MVISILECNIYYKFFFIHVVGLFKRAFISADNFFDAFYTESVNTPSFFVVFSTLPLASGALSQEFEQVIISKPLVLFMERTIYFFVDTFAASTALSSMLLITVPRAVFLIKVKLAVFAVTLKRISSLLQI